MENKEEVKLLEEGLEEQDESGLVVRKSRKADKPTSEFELEVSNGVSESNGHKEEEEVPIPEEEPRVEVLEVGINGSENRVPIPEEEPKAEVVEVGTNGSEDEVLIPEEKPKIEDLDGVVEVGSSGSTKEAINGEYKPQGLVYHDKDEGFGPALHTHIEEKQIPKDVNKFEIPSNEIESVEAADLINEEDLEADDLDVEGVLKKQNTHDLYCPNCNSCITRRVILCKRKRRVRLPDEEAKRAKNDTELGAATARPGDGIDVSDIQPLTADEDERSSRGPSIFECLSCFSFFVPIGNGLFRLFGEKSGSGYVADEQALSTNETGNRDSTIIEIRRPSDGTVATAGDNDTKSGGDTLISPRQKPLLNGKVITAEKDRIDMAPTETIDAKLEQFDSYTEDQLKESKVNKEVHITRESDLSVAAFPATNQFTNGETKEDSVSFLNKGGLKLLVPASNGSPVIENSNSKDSQVSNQTMQSGDKGAFQVLPTSISVLQALDVNGNLNIPMPVPHKDREAATLDKSVLENKEGMIQPSEVSQLIVAKTKVELHSSEPIKVDSISYPPAGQGKDTVIAIPVGSSQVVPAVVQPPETAPLLQAADQPAERTEERKEYQVEVIKSIVYGGLAELITSLSVVSSAAGGGAATLNVLALGMANLIGGLFIIFHNLWELREECTVQVANQISDGVTEQKDRYKELLGRRQNFILHATVAIISYLVFGLLPPALYGFSFRKSDDKQLKLVVVSVASLTCVVSLAIGKAYVRTPPKHYLKCVMSFVILGFMVSGVSYAVGKLVERILVKFGVFPSSAGSNPSTGTAWTSY